MSLISSRFTTHFEWHCSVQAVTWIKNYRNFSEVVPIEMKRWPTFYICFVKCTGEEPTSKSFTIGINMGDLVRVWTLSFLFWHKYRFLAVLPILAFVFWQLFHVISIRHRYHIVFRYTIRYHVANSRIRSEMKFHFQPMINQRPGNEVFEKLAIVATACRPPKTTDQRPDFCIDHHQIHKLRPRDTFLFTVLVIDKQFRCCLDETGHVQIWNTSCWRQKRLANLTTVHKQCYLLEKTVTSFHRNVGLNECTIHKGY